MFSKLQAFDFQHLSVGNAFQNMAFYSLVLLMLAMIVVQLNVNIETGTRKFIIDTAVRAGHSVQLIYRGLYFRLKQVFAGRIRKARA